MLANKLNKLSLENRNSFYYLVFSIIGYGVSFIQNFVFAWLVPLQFYGEITLAYSIFSLSMAVFMFGLGSAISRFYFDKINFDLSKLITNITAAWIIIGIILLVISFILVTTIYKYYDIDKINRSSVLLLILGGFFNSYFESMSMLFTSQEKPLHYGLYLVFNRLILFVATLMAIFYSQDIVTLSCGYFFGSILMFFAGVVTFYKKYTLDFSLKEIKKIISFSSPLALNTFGNLGFTQGFKVLISPFISLSELGIFDFASKISNISYLIGTSVSKGSMPKAYKKLEESNQIRSIKFYKKILIRVSLISTFSIYALSLIFLYYFKNGEYFTSIYILPFLLLGQSILLIFSYYYIYYSYTMKTKVITYSLLTGAFFSLLLSYILVIKYNFGIIGASVSICCGYGVQYFIGYRLSKKV